MCKSDCLFFNTGVCAEKLDPALFKVLGPGKTYTKKPRSILRKLMWKCSSGKQKPGTQHHSQSLSLQRTGDSQSPRASWTVWLALCFQESNPDRTPFSTGISGQPLTQPLLTVQLLQPIFKIIRQKKRIQSWNEFPDGSNLEKPI